MAMYRLLVLALFAALPGAASKETSLHATIDMQHQDKRGEQPPPIGELIPADCWPEMNIVEPAKCYYLHAPLDYLNESDHRTARLAVGVYPAGGGKTKREDIQGTMIMGAGGPGSTGLGLFARVNSSAFYLDRELGGRYNIMGWDPRGVGRSTPTANCYRWEKQREQGKAEFLYPHSSNVANAISHSKARLWAALCAENATLADELRFVGTKSTARDVRLLYRAAKDKVLNFWGHSYGTAIGVTFADTYPDEVGKMVLDGVMDVFGLRSGHLSEGVRSGQDVWEKGFLGECVKAGELCSLNSLAKGRPLKDVVEEWIDGLIQHPLISTTTNTTLLTYSAVKSVLLDGLLSPLSWSFLHKALADAMKGDPKLFIAGLVEDTSGPKDPSLSPMAFAAIAAADSLTHKGDKWTLQDYEEMVREVERTSPFTGANWVTHTSLVQAWKIQGKDQHTGNFTSKTRTPILFVGIDYDASTAFYHARRLATLFPNAALLRVEGAFGHTSKTQPSKCAHQTIDDYLIKGIVPPRGKIQTDGMVDAGTICAVDRGLYDFTGRKMFPLGEDGKSIAEVPPSGGGIGAG